MGEEVGIALKVLLAVMGGIITLGGGTAVVARWAAPYRGMKEEVTRHRELLINDKERLDDMERFNRAMGSCMLALLHHEITGNDIVKLERAKEQLQEYLLSR